MHRSRFQQSNFIPWWTDEDACLEYLFIKRFRNTKCDHCGRRGKYYRHLKKQCYTCACGCSHVYPRKDTVFQNSPLPLPKWFCAIWLLAESGGELKSVELQRTLNVSYPTAWSMLRKLHQRIPKRSQTSFDRMLNKCIY